MMNRQRPMSSKSEQAEQMRRSIVLHKFKCLLAFCVVVVGGWVVGGDLAAQSSKSLTEQIDWQKILAEHDLVWQRFPKAWFEAPFFGNGEQGTLLRQLNKKTLRWDVGCSAAHDHRPPEQDDLTEKNVVVLNRGRHTIGYLKLTTPVDLSSCDARVSLWDAEGTGTFASASRGGKLTWKTIVHATEPVMYFEFTAEGDLAGADFVYVPEAAQSPRAVRAKTPRKPAHPAAKVGSVGEVQTAVHNLVAGGQTAVAWHKKRSGKTTQLWLSVQHSYPGADAVKLAVAAVEKASSANQKNWVQQHRDWWHEYYPASYISTGDPYWDSFYWIQQYKLACATREKGWVIDNQGPWLQPTAWNAGWWNLNVQLSHTGVYQANRRGMGSALSHRLDINRESLALNVAEPYRSDSYGMGRTASGWDFRGYAGQPGGREPMDGNISREMANLLWAMHNVDVEYRYWVDEQLRDDVLYPLLVRAVNYYRHFLVKEKDGRYHLPQTYSPEYRKAKDCAYDIDFLRWGVSRLIELAEEKKLSNRDEPLLKVWKDLEKNLVAAHVGPKGRMIGKDVPLSGGHRHWSHLMAVYPLRMLTPEADADRKLIQQSVDHWHSFGRGVAGYAFTAASCMESMLGDGEQALVYLEQLKSYLKPNTFYSEIGLPVMETPLHGATAMQEMMLQSWGGRLRVFPAVPPQWPHVQFAQLRGVGAFLVSGDYAEGEAKWVLVQAERSGQIEVDPQMENADWAASGQATVEKLESGVYQIKTKPGDSVLFWPKGSAKPELDLKPVKRRGKAYRFGLPKVSR